MPSIFDFIIFSILILGLLTCLPLIFRANALSPEINKPISINNPHIRAEVIATGIKFPTSMAFLGSNDILVLEKNDGTVKRITNGSMFGDPLLDVNVSTGSERGMLGIAVAKNTPGPTYVFLYYTESAAKEATDVIDGQPPLGNRLYRYELINNKLVNPKLLLDLPAAPASRHNGGKLAIGPDQNIYLVIGDMEGATKSQNIKNGTSADGRGGILRVTYNGTSVGKGILGNTFPLDLYYAYGIRNSFGIGFDPVTGRLWDTENGPGFGDEINFVPPGFNSGWKKVQGELENNKEKIKLDKASISKNLVDYGGKGKYSAPEFTWNGTVGPTALTFFNSTKLGKEYENDLLVGDFHNGYIYHFKLNKDRTKLVWGDQHTDRMADTKEELNKIIFAQGFGGITDLQIGPDGYLYVLSVHNGGANCEVLRDKSKPCISYNSGVEGTIFRLTNTRIH